MQALLRANLDAMEKIVFNFLSNALKYTPTDGKIVLALYEVDDVVRIDIQDTVLVFHPRGKQCPLRSSVRLMNPQLERSKVQASVWRQLGELAEKMGGRVGVESTVGEGSNIFRRALSLRGTVH